MIWEVNPFMKTFRLWCLAGALLFLAACAAPSEKRIAAHPEVFGSLNDADKVLVRQGEVRRGMSKEAVRLAWGDPDHETTEHVGGASCDRWVYTGYLPVEGYHVRSSRAGEGQDTTFVPPVMADRSLGNYAPGTVRDASFKDGSLIAWKVAY